MERILIMKTLEQIQQENRSVICVLVRDYITAPLTVNRVILALNLSKKEHSHIKLDPTKKTLEEQTNEVQREINKLLTK